MGAFGERLRREREMRGITLEEIAAATKIGTRNLKALEDENFKILPGGIFNKGFVRAYSRFLGINEEQAISDYLAACGELEQGPEVDAAQLLAQRETLEAESRAASRKAKQLHDLEVDGPSGFPWVALVGLVIIVALAWGGRVGYVKYKAHQERQAQIEREAQEQARLQAERAAAEQAAAQKAAAEQAALNAALTRTGSQADTGSPAASAQGMPGAAQSGLSVQGQQMSAKPTESKQQQPASPSASSAPQTTKQMTVLPGNFVLSVRARQKIWLSVTADGKNVMTGELEPSTKRDFQARDHITIKTGNAGGTDVALNGKVLPSLGAESQVRTVTINAEGIVQ